MPAAVSQAVSSPQILVQEARPDLEGRPAGDIADGTDEFGRAAIDSVVSRKGLSLSLEVGSAAEVIETSARLEAFLLGLASFTGGTFARVAPRFLKDTYPAMLALAARLNRSWRAEGERIVRVGDARLAFVSADRPAFDPRGVDSRPNRMIEVVAAHRIDPDWFRSRVAPRTQTEGLTRVFYGPAEAADSLFARVRRANLDLEARDGVRRHFSTSGRMGRDVDQARVCRAEDGTRETACVRLRPAS